MNRHPFDPISFVLGVAAVALGLLVALGGVDDVRGGWATWFAVASLAVGIALVPWRRHPQTAVHVPDSSSPVTPEP